MFEAKYTPEVIQSWRDALAKHDSVAGAVAELGVPARSMHDAFARRGEYAGQWLRVPRKSKPGGGGRRGECTRVGIIRDVHVPYHDELAWTTTLKSIEAMQQSKLGLDTLVILGDFGDCYDISDFPKHPNRAHDYESEVDAVRAQLARVSRLGIPRVVFLSGNHEDRLPRFLTKNAPQLYNLVSIPELYGIRARGWEWVPYGESIAIGKIHYSHDWGACGKYAVQRQLEIGHSVVAGHTHRAGCAYGGGVAITSPTDQRRVSWSMGWLGDFESLAFSYTKKWKARAEWTHGFGTATMDPTGVGWVHFHPVIEGRAVVDGKVVSGREKESGRAPKAAA